MVGRCAGTDEIKLSVLGRPTKGQGPTVLAVGAGGGLDIFLSSILSLFFLPLWETARFRLKYYLKGPLNKSNK